MSYEHLDYDEYWGAIDEVKDALIHLKDVLEGAERDGYECDAISSAEVESIILSVNDELDELTKLDREFPTSDYERYGVRQSDFM